MSTDGHLKNSTRGIRDCQVGISTGGFLRARTKDPLLLTALLPMAHLHKDYLLKDLLLRGSLLMAPLVELLCR